MVYVAHEPGALPPDPGDIFKQMKAAAAPSLVLHLCDQGRMVLRHNLRILGQFFRGKMMCWGQKVEGTKDLRLVHDGNIDARTEVERCDQRMVKEVLGKFRWRIGDEDLLRGDAQRVPSIMGQGFGAARRIGI